MVPRIEKYIELEEFGIHYGTLSQEALRGMHYKWVNCSRRSLVDIGIAYTKAFSSGIDLTTIIKAGQWQHDD